ncbi:MFS transporter [Cognatishimia maritima]|uniref:Predicted arabinose efflux permease, MFS family n=1 Tax=Cognatishimia maritima TaxID=870908 RepID=A0A1M5S5Q7_9RHOB|nr:MFS transporter [Cognatishimia maritima]SHH33826.1 Predicted arabinose efflux permease, MFS family [Cognatishimia maritima]
MASPTRLWLAITAAFMVNGAFYGVWAARIPAIAQEFALSHRDLGLLLLLLALGAILCFPIAGRMSDRHGAPLVTRLLTLGKAVSMLGLAHSPNVSTLALSLFCFGACHGGMDVAMNAWGADVERAAKRTWMPSFHAMWSLGAGLGALSGFAAVSADLTYTTHFLFTLVLVPLLGFWGMNIRWEQSTRGASPKKSSWFPLPRGMLLLVGVFAACTTIGEGAMADWSAIYLLEVAQTAEHIAPLGLAVFSSAMVFMRLLGGIVIAKLGPTQAAITSGIAAVLGTGIVVFGASTAILMLGFIAMGFGYALAMPIAFSRAGNDPHTPPAQAIASVATLGYGGILLGPPVIGFLSEFVSLRGAFGVLLALALLMLVIAPTIRADATEAEDLA